MIIYLTLGLALYIALTCVLIRNKIHRSPETLVHFALEVFAFLLVLYFWPYWAWAYHTVGDETVQEMKENRKV